MFRDVLSLGKELADKVTNVVMNYTEVEVKVRAATNDDPWGPTGQDMQELAELSHHYEAYPQVMGMIWRRMFQEQRGNWRRTYKSLLLLAYLVRNGSDKVVVGCKEHMYDLRLLESYQFVDENGKDQGVNVRHRVKDILELLQSPDKLRAERKKAVLNRKKCRNGISGGSTGTNGYSSYHDDSTFSYHRDQDQYTSPSTPPPQPEEDDYRHVEKKAPAVAAAAVVSDLLDLSPVSCIRPAAPSLSSRTAQLAPDQPDLFKLSRTSGDFGNFVAAPNNASNNWPVTQSNAVIPVSDWSTLATQPIATEPVSCWPSVQPIAPIPVTDWSTPAAQPKAVAPVSDCSTLAAQPIADVSVSGWLTTQPTTAVPTSDWSALATQPSEFTPKSGWSASTTQQFDLLAQAPQQPMKPTQASSDWLEPQQPLKPSPVTKVGSTWADLGGLSSMIEMKSTSSSSGVRPGGLTLLQLQQQQQQQISNSGVQPMQPPRSSSANNIASAKATLSGPLDDWRNC